MLFDWKLLPNIAISNHKFIILEIHMYNTKNCFSENGNKFVRYYNPEGPNNAFNKLNGIFQRGVEEEASIQTAAKIKNSYPEESYNDWLKNHTGQPEMEKRAKLEFIKKCEELALLPEKELLKLSHKSSERLSMRIFEQEKGESIENEINERAYRMKNTYQR